MFSQVAHMESLTRTSAHEQHLNVMHQGLSVLLP